MNQQLIPASQTAIQAATLICIIIFHSDLFEIMTG